MADNSEEKRVTDADYAASVSEFERMMVSATEMSRACAGQPSTPRTWWASVLFTRLCLLGTSIMKLAPGSTYASPPETWDLASIASISRVVIECYLVLFYLCVEDVTEDERMARITLMQLRDNVSRQQMFTGLGVVDNDVQYEANSRDLRDRLNANAFFAALPAARRQHLLLGLNALMLKQEEIVTRMGDDLPSFEGINKLLSAQVHSMPLAFYRTGEADRGRGIESAADKSLIALIIENVSDYLYRAINNMRTLFTGIELPKESAPPKRHFHSS